MTLPSPTSLTDATHAPTLRSWVPSANVAGTDFPVQNLPLGRFRRLQTDEPWAVGVAIGSQVLDLRLAAQQCPWGDGVHELLAPLAAGELADFMAMGQPAWRALRRALSAALAEGSNQAPFLELCLLPQQQVEMALPCTVHNYTDFYAGIHHALAVGKLFRPDNPLLPNYKWVPIGYHGRTSSIGLGGDIHRPHGQTRAAGDVPEFGPSKRLDYELEMGALVGPGTRLGETLTMVQAEERLFGLTLLNDWSARDIQAWEYQPLGPFLAKSFGTSISPWVVSMEALAPFRRPFMRPAEDPQPLPYLDSAFNQAAGSLDITLEVWLQTAAMAQPVRLSQSNLQHAYWTWAQLLTHQASNGCNLQTGDLLGSGTMSGPAPAQGGSLLELTQGGRVPLALPGGESRTFLQDGDTVTLRGYCDAPGAVRIGFGSLSGTVRDQPEAVKKR
jgi:fumarylacetoacetase